MCKIEIVAIVGAYLVGSIPTSFIVGKLFFGLDIRAHGSGNVGATNTFFVLGKYPGSFVLLADIIKGLVPVYVYQVYLADAANPARSLNMALFVGIAAISGHIWTLFLGFKGGKGVATSAGVFMALAPVATCGVLLVFVAVLLAFRYVSLASICSVVVLPLILFYRSAPMPIMGLSLLIGTFVVVRHRSNIQRLLDGSERKISLFDKKVTIQHTEKT